MYIIVNTHKNNKIASDLLLESIPTEFRLLVVEGGHEECTISCILDTLRYKMTVNHNSIDFTGMIGVVENIDLITSKTDWDIPKYWFYIHDTCKVVEPVRFASIFNRPYTNNNYPLCKFPSMNMGVYLHKDFMIHKNLLLSFKSDVDTQHLKAKCVTSEDILFKKAGTSNNVLSVKTNLPGFFRYPSSTVDRIQEYYVDVGLLKYKANWHTKKVYELHY